MGDTHAIERVLVVGDDVLVLGAFRYALGGLGLTALTATSTSSSGANLDTTRRSP